MTIAIISSKGITSRTYSNWSREFTGRQIDNIISLVAKEIERSNGNYFQADMNEELPEKIDRDMWREIDFISEPLSKADAVVFVISLLYEIGENALEISLSNYREKYQKQTSRERKPGILIGCVDSIGRYNEYRGMDEHEKILRGCGISIVDRFLVTKLNKPYMMMAISESVSMLAANYDNFSAFGIKNYERYREWLNSNGCRTEQEKRQKEMLEVRRRQSEIKDKLLQNQEKMLRNREEILKNQEKMLQGKDNIIHLQEKIIQEQEAMIADRDKMIDQAKSALTSINEDIRKLEKELADLDDHRTAQQRNIVSRYESAVSAIESGEYEHAAENLRDALEPVLSDDQYKWGVFYFNGEGIEVDYLKALFWFEKAAAQDHAKANRAIGIVYINGIGVEVDYEAALHYLNRAAELGSVNALAWLGLCYINGWGVEGDDEKAFSFFERAANKGDMQGVRLMGVCYESGRGVEKDLDKALERYRKAAEGGDKDASQNLEELQKAMSGTEKTSESE